MKNLLFASIFLSASCSSPATNSAEPTASEAALPVQTVSQRTTQPAPKAAMAYDFTRPVATYSMPSELAELSGIALAGSTHITGIEDETGNLYEYNLSTKKVDRVIPFAGSGDYEDVARVGSDWFIMRSDGKLFRYSGGKTEEFETGLSFDNETEGLTYDAASKTLLVACKGEPGAGLSFGQRAIYRLNPETFKAEPKPAYVLDVEAIRSSSPATDAAAGKSGKKSKKKGGGKGFSPSALAVHPVTGHVFVLSAKQNGIVELDKNGQLLAAQPLPDDLFPQAEGMTFTPSGDLYVATEAGKGSGEASIYLFRTQSR
ncbi:SdiA-regulated domain-containing protein [Hymenobacter cellulosivorans]|uniref:SdiA-regulated domain-containing protein n=1 Tax=Hymenobacter cellulosivorans TaxID=2932249 RepID=A0ABY4FD15_9BACT|nr:SdiA-regulated domain-containing protein [Hymenobacter cellulosivorans]UOQ53882.1 SdiA-regulated domain-containing protein [Hymenobacter cellulosivorans]